MAKKRATEGLNVALAGVSSALAIMETVDGDARARLIQKAQEYVAEAHKHLTTIQFHVGHI